MTVQTMQSDARNVAQNGPNNLGLDPNHPGQQLPNVPNGLTTGGLQVLPGATWQNANLPTPSTSNGQYTVTITQTAPKAILTWQTFNVGKNTTVDFDQSAGTQNGTNNWIALNRILDPTGVPSQILGSIKADGQVYLINQNGIIFGGTSQVNVNTLYASTLNIPDASFNEGYLAFMANVYGSGNTFSTTMGNASPSAGTTNPSFSRFYQNSDTVALGPTLTATTAPKAGDVTVQPGASITTAESGTVVLLGEHVNSSGTISTPDGQTILAAGDSAYLYAQPTPQMRGLSVDVLIDRNTNNINVNPLADSTAGTVTNAGIITVGEGNATMDGAHLVQNGVIKALTGVNSNGSIILTARYAPDTFEAEAQVNGNNNSVYIAPTIPGSITFGPYSVTQVLPDLSDPTTTLDAQGFNPSVIVVQGKNVTFEGASFAAVPLDGSDGQAIAPGALLMAPGGTVSVTAPVSYDLVNQVKPGAAYATAYNITNKNAFLPVYQGATGASILIDNGATIDVSGTQDVSIPVSRNVVAVNLRANELADSPLQRNGPLYGKTVYVDITETGQNADGSTWYGTPFANASGYIAVIGRTVAERTAVGGEINLISGGGVVAVNGSTMNVSGGWIDYQGGLVATTRLLGTDGRLYDISNAEPSITYVGIAGTISIAHPRWGVTEVFNTPLVGSTDQQYESSYLDGRSAGSIAITANQMVLDGTMLGNSVSGPRQRTINANVDSSVPLGGSLTLQAPPDTSNLVAYMEPTEEGLTFVIDHGNLTPDQVIALASGTVSLSDPSIDRDQTLLLPVDMFSAGGFTTLSTEVSSEITTSTPVTSVTSVSPFVGNVLLPEGVNLNFGTAASGTLNFNYDGTVARNSDGTLSTVSINQNNSANVTVDTYGSVDLEGSITAPAGKIVFNAGVLYGPKLLNDASYLANPPSITIGSIAGSDPTFNLRGLWTSETSLTTDNDLQPLWINGGSFSLSAPGSIKISSGSTFDVTGGGEAPSTGKLAANDEGKGGSLSFRADTDPYLSGNTGFLEKSNLQPVQFNGTLLAYGLGGDGTLTLGAGAITFSNDPGTAITSAIIQTSAGPTPGIIIPAGLLSGGQFSSYTFASSSDLTVPEGTQLDVTQKVLEPTSIQQLLNAATGSNIYAFTRPFLLPQFKRPPASIALTANTTITIGNAATIETDPGGSITLRATPLTISTSSNSPVAATLVNVYGTLDAPAGSITLDAGFTVDNNTSPTGDNTIYLGPQSVVSADGASLLYLDQFGHQVGSVLGGGSVTIQNALYFVAAPGSLIDVSGAQAREDLATGRQIGLEVQYAPSLVASNGGSILISALDGLFIDGTLRGRPGDYGDPDGSVAVGGSLTIQIIGQPVTNGIGASPFVTYDNGGLIISQNNLFVPATSSATSFSPNKAIHPGAGFISVQTLENGGFDTVDLQASQFIQFIGNVTLSGLDNLELHAPTFSATSTYSATGNYLSNDNPTVTISASHIFLDGFGAANLSPADDIVTNKSVLNVNAGTLDLDGFSSGMALTPLYITPSLIVYDYLEPLPSIGEINFSASGDLRFVGAASAKNSVTSAGSAASFNANNNLVLSVPVSFQATQIYPLSGVTETIVDTYQPVQPTDPASVMFARSSLSDTGATPLSAGGSLSVFAPVIVQGGVIKVPLGSLSLGSNTKTQLLTLTPDSVTSVSLDGNIVPFGVTTQSGTIWVVNQPVGESPPVGVISLSGANIRLQSDLQSGASAVINGSGGGDLHAYEFAPGVGGSSDVLDQPAASNAPGVYAILPGYDQYSLLGSPASVFNSKNPSSPDAVPQYGQMVHLAGVAGLPSGNYVLLPAHYALLPGGYSVTLASSSISAMAQNVVNPVGSYDVLGYLDTATNSGVRANGTHNPWQQFLVQSGSVVRQDSQYIESDANSFAYLASTDITSVNYVPISPFLPEDAGQLVITPTESLDLDGTGLFDHAPGTIGGRVDLNITKNVAIVGSGGADGTTGASGTDYANSAIVITASGINNLHAESVLIGGTRDIAAEATQQTHGPAGLPNETYIVAATPNLTVDNDAGSALQAPEIILVSNDVIDLKPASVIRSVGAVNGPSNGDLDFVTDFGFVSVNSAGGFEKPTGAAGAVVRVSNGANANFNRFDAPLAPISGDTGYGNLVIESGAQINSGNAILLEGYQSATLATGALLTAPSITAAGKLVSLGNVPGTNGLTFSGQTFAGLNATQNLTLISSTSIDIWGTAGQTTNIGNANLVNLVLDAGQISNRVNGSNVTLTAGNVTLQASSSYDAPEGSSSGSLTVKAVTLANGSGGQLTIGPGDKVLDGFSAATLAASKEIISQGLLANPQPEAFAEPGSLTVTGSLTFLTPLLTAASDSYQKITATGAFVLTESPGTSPTSSLQSLNAGFYVTAGSVDLGSSIVMPSGVFSVEAMTGDIVVHPGALINVSGVAQQFFDQVRYAPGGQINLSSDLGNVMLAQGSTINVSGFMGAPGVAAGGDAGTFEVSAGANAPIAAAGVFTSQGQLMGSAASGNQSGSFVLNTGTLPDYSGLNAELNAGGFAASRNFRIRTGNVVITNTAIAHTFILSADGADGVSAGSGNITVQGIIDASGTTGGTIELAAGGNVTLGPGSLLDAHATSVALDGYGKPIDAENEATVEIDTVSGTLNLAGGTINVAVPGADSVTGQSFGGDVHLRVLAANAASTVAGSIIGAKSVELEAYETYSFRAGGVIDQNTMNTLEGMFNSISVAVPAGLANVSNLHVRGGIEVDSFTGDIIVDDGTTGWDFSTWRSVNGEPGYLTLRAAGNININSSLSDGFNGVTTYDPATATATYHAVQTTGASWAYTLASGADLRAADVTQVESTSKLAGEGTEGDFTLAPDTYIRTGTGDITIAVGGDMTFGDALSTIYSAGVPTTPSNPAVDFNNPAFNPNAPYNAITNPIPNPINFPTDGGNISITTQGSIIAVQTPQLITDWLWRQGGENPSTSSTQPATYTPEAWGPIFGLPAPVYSSGMPGGKARHSLVSQIGDYSFAQGIGALAGGNIAVRAGGRITDLSVVIPSNGYQTSATGTPTSPNDLVIQGGGNLMVRAGGDIGPATGDSDLAGTASGGPGAIFYVARGTGNISTTRLTSASGSITAEIAMDDAIVSVRSGGDLKLAPFDPMAEDQVFANQNNYQNNPGTLRSIFRSNEFGYTSRTELDETSYAGNILPAFEPYHAGEFTDQNYQFLHQGWGNDIGGAPTEYDLFSLTGDVGPGVATSPPLGSVQVLPPTMLVAAFLGSISAGTPADVAAGYYSLYSSNKGVDDFQFPAPRGTADYLAYQDISILPALSDADPAGYPTLSNPQAFAELLKGAIGANFLVSLVATFPEQNSSIYGSQASSISQAHWAGILHSGDTDPVHVYSVTGNISNTGPAGAQNWLFEIPKPVWIKAGEDVTLLLNQAFVQNQQVYLTQWIENTAPSDVSVIEAGLDLNLNVRIDGPGTLYVQAGRNLIGTSQIISEGNGDDTSLPSQGANITVIAGVGGIGAGYGPDYSAFIKAYFNPANTGSVAENYLDTVESAEGLGPDAALVHLENLSPELQATYVLPAYYNELKMSGRDYNNPSASDYHSYSRGFAAIDTLFPGSQYQGSLDLSKESVNSLGPDNPNNIKELFSSNEINYGDISSVRGGNIELLAPGGPITVGQPTGSAALNSGLTTVRGGSISTYSAGSVEVNQSRLATLGGGAILIWAGDTNPALVPNPPLDKIANIDAGKGSKTELVAPAQSFLVDDATAEIALDPAAVATGNGIATLPAEKGAPPSDIDLIAPDGTVNASDAGIRVSGNFNVAALHVVTNGNVTVAGTSVGVPTVVAPNIGGLTAASNTAGASSNAGEQVANQAAAQTQQQELPSLITVEVLGYGGGG